jgi:hypothetical protein
MTYHRSGILLATSNLFACFTKFQWAIAFILVVFYERGVSSKNFSDAGDQEFFLRSPALSLPFSHAAPLQRLTE